MARWHIDNQAPDLAALHGSQLVRHHLDMASNLQFLCRIEFSKTTHGEEARICTQRSVVWLKELTVIHGWPHLADRLSRGYG